MALPGTVSAPHFDRTAFKVKRIYATLTADGRSANLKFTPEEQAREALENGPGQPRIYGGAAPHVNP